MIDDLGNDLDHVESRLDSNLKRVAKVLHLNNGKFYQNFTYIYYLIFKY